MDFHFHIKTNPTFLPLPEEINLLSIVENQFICYPFQQEFFLNQMIGKEQFSYQSQNLHVTQTYP